MGCVRSSLKRVVGRKIFSECEGPFPGKQPCSIYGKATTIVSRHSCVPPRPYFTLPTLRFLK